MEAIEAFIWLTTQISPIFFGVFMAVAFGRGIVNDIRESFQVIIPEIEIDTELKRKAKDHHYEYDGEGADYGEVVGFGDDGEMIFGNQDKKSP